MTEQRCEYCARGEEPENGFHVIPIPETSESYRVTCIDHPPKNAFSDLVEGAPPNQG